MKTTWPVLLVWLLLAAPVAQAQFTYTTNSGVITLAAYTGGAGTVVISNFVTIIAADAFRYITNTNVTSVTIPSSVTSIGNYAFGNGDCANLVSVTMADGVTNIGNGAFADTSLTNVAIPQ
jgi:hypothetical protein